MLHLDSDTGFIKSFHKGAELKENSVKQQISKLAHKPNSEFGFQIPAVKELLEKATSISGVECSTIFCKLLKTANNENKSLVIASLVQLINIPHDEDELISELRKSKVDGPFALALLWSSENKVECLRVVEILLKCCSIDLMLTGQKVVGIWRSYIEKEMQKRTLLQQIKSYCNFVCKNEQSLQILDIPL